MTRTIILLLFFIHSSVIAQIGIGQWRDHLPYSKTIAVTEGDQSRIYCATPFGAMFYSKADGSISRLNQVTGLSDVSISTLNYDKATDYLVICYNNANIDLYHNDRIYNLSDIKRKPMVGSKRINRIVFRDKLAYLCTDFGIVVLDPVRREIKDTYYIGPNGTALIVNDLAFDDSLFYAATSDGIYSARIKDPFLSNYQVWTKDLQIQNPDANYNAVCVFKGNLYANLSSKIFATDTVLMKSQNQWQVVLDSLKGPNKSIKNINDTALLVVGNYDFSYFWDDFKENFVGYTYPFDGNPVTPLPQDVIFDKDGIVWIADQRMGLLRSRKQWHYDKIKVSGPPYENAWSMTASESGLWVASGALESNWDNQNLSRGIYNFKDEKWTAYTRYDYPVFDTVRDIVEVAVNPKNPDEIYLASWGKGLVQMRKGKVTKIFNTTNSGLKESVIYPGFIGVGGLQYDDNGNLWLTNSSTPDGLHMLGADGRWHTFSLVPLVSSDVIGDLVIDDYGQKWIIMPRGHGIIVYNDNNTIDNVFDDDKKRLNMDIGNGDLPSNGVYSLAVDRKGEVWVGTDKGVAVFYSPGLVFSGDNFDAQQIYIEQEGISQYLLESETVTAIAIDGANRKWFGTRNAGVFLMSEDGSKQIHHFTQENSPLLSDNIFSIAIDGQSGEVFFGTENGIVSYRSDATLGKDYQQDTVIVFPNPVRPEYNGPIAVNGLYENAEIRIADTYGNVVYEGKALGGQAVWNGKNYSGERVATGVYFVFSSNEDGEFTKVAKILFIH
jgi:ligand-binding sensor domain-containing protein